jgi:predicted ATPase/DNA-binding SARP family transcriptional activator
VLGPLEVVADGRDLTPARPKQRALLALLLLRRNEVVSSDELIEALWGGSPPETAQTALHGHVSALRKLLGAEAIETRAPGYLLRLAPERLDLGRFEALIEQARPEQRAERRAELLRSALALFRGEPLADFRYEAFAREEIARLEELRVAALEERIQAELELERHGELVPELERLVTAHPLRERLRVQLMLALYRSGRQADALYAYQEGRRILVEELGLDPGPALQELERRILQQDPVLGLAAPENRPTGTVSFLFTDIEGSTRLLHELGAQYADALEAHRRLLRTAFAGHRGHEVDTQGDAFFIAFASATDAVACAVEAQRALARHSWPEDKELRVRMGLHTCEARPTSEGYVGIGVHRAARICAAGHGGQVLLSQTTRELLVEEPVEDVDLRDLGPHRLKDLTQPERIFQVVAAELGQEFPPLDTLDARPTNLPTQPTALVGRERELGEARERLLREDIRLLTFTGPGGTGKTRLALQVAAEVVEQFPAGTFFVGLAPIADPELVVPAIARALSVRESAGRSVAETLEDYLRERKLLLLIDNFEHVVTGAPAVADLLAAAPWLKVLATSREPLHLAGERVYAVPPLDLPPDVSVDALAANEAVALFVERAQAIRPDFELRETNALAVAEICRRLDGLPLAIELAAARIVLFPPAALLARLDARLKLLTAGARDQPPRHQTLRAALDWSHDLLSEQRKALFARLAVFAGGWTLEAAEAICDGDLDVVDGLASLLDKSLVHLEGTEEEPRFAMLETIREYGLERLDESGEAADVRRRHAEHFLAFAQTARGYARGPDEFEWLERTQLELDNIRAALGWAIESSDGELGLALAEALEPFWYRRVQLREGLSWLEPLLELAPDAPPALRGAALAVAGRLASELGSADRARPWYEESLPLVRAAGDRVQEAWALHGLGVVAALEGDRTRARGLLEQSFELFLELGQHAPAAGRLTYLAQLAQQEGDLPAARSYVERSVVEYGAAGDADGVAGSTLGLGDLALDEADWPRARDYYRAALAHGAREPQTRMYLLGGLAAVAAAAGRRADAGRLWGAAERIESEFDHGIDEHQRAQYELVLGELDADEVDAGRALTDEEALGLAREIAGSESIAASRGSKRSGE